MTLPGHEEHGCGQGRQAPAGQHGCIQAPPDTRQAVQGHRHPAQARGQPDPQGCGACHIG
jgi:hypothetical protein